MASSQRPDRDDLNDSWVELHYAAIQKMDPEELKDSGLDPLVSYTGSLEKLLIDAQRESRTPSRPNSQESSIKGSPKSPSTPNSEWSNEEWAAKQDLGTDWIWDWSSRPEAQQSFDNLSEKFRHPAYKGGRSTLSVRNTEVMKKTRLFSWSNLPTLLLTHACTFFLGAAAVFLYLRKYCNVNASTIARISMD